MLLSIALCSTYVPEIESLPKELLLLVDEYLGYKRVEVYIRLINLPLTDVEMMYLTSCLTASSLTEEMIKQNIKYYALTKKKTVREHFIQFVLDKLKQLSIMYEVAQIFYRPCKDYKCGMESKHRFENIMNDTEGDSQRLYLRHSMVSDPKYIYQVLPQHKYGTDYVSREETLLVFLACQFEYEWYSIADYEHSKTCEHKMRIRFKAKDYNPTKKEMLSYRVLKKTYLR